MKSYQELHHLQSSPTIPLNLQKLISARTSSEPASIPSSNSSISTWTASCFLVEAPEEASKLVWSAASFNSTGVTSCLCFAALFCLLTNSISLFLACSSRWNPRIWNNKKYLEKYKRLHEMIQHLLNYLKNKKGMHLCSMDALIQSINTSTLTTKCNEIPIWQRGCWTSSGHLELESCDPVSHNFVGRLASSSAVVGETNSLTMSSKLLASSRGSELV